MYSSSKLGRPMAVATAVTRVTTRKITKNYNHQRLPNTTTTTTKRVLPLAKVAPLSAVDITAEQFMTVNTPSNENTSRITRRHFHNYHHHENKSQDNCYYDKTMDHVVGYCFPLTTTASAAATTTIPAHHFSTSSSSFATDYDEWYSHGSTGGETRESRGIYSHHVDIVEDLSKIQYFDNKGIGGSSTTSQNHNGVVTALDKEDGLLLEAAMSGVFLDDQDPYKQEEEGSGFQELISYYTMIEDHHRHNDKKAQQRDGGGTVVSATNTESIGVIEDFVELEEDVWILHNQNLDVIEAEDDLQDLSDDSSLEY